ncbi:MAG: PAS domain-containing sensor histidine kinase [Muribaculaceae bacterium]|nr:PAS domain-containing sensor histidine kinase [Muribaculaceae bacterium]
MTASRRHSYQTTVFAVLAALLVGAAIWLVVLTSGAGTKQFFVAQAVLLLAILLLGIFYRRVIRPINTLATGIDLLREQDFTSRLRCVGQPDADRIVLMFNDMIAILKRERLQLREKNHFLDLLVAASPMGVMILHTDGSIDHVNRACARIFNSTREELRGMRLESIDNPVARAITTLPIGGSTTVRLNNSMIYRCARLTYIDRGYPHYFIIIEKLTEEVARAERVAYEQIIRVMAHEVNNSMGGIGSILDTLASCTDDPDTASLLVAGRHRCESLSRFVSAYAEAVKVPEAHTVRTNLTEFITDTLPLLESICSSRRIEVITHVPHVAVYAHIDPVLMEQVLLNLVKNSAESIGSDGTVTITLRTDPLRLTIADNGAGISPENAQKLFTPFFSSKNGGRGLGLMLVTDILRKHGYTYSLATGTDGITRFTITMQA